MVKTFIPKVWQEHIIKELEKPKLFTLVFEPKYKGNNKFLRWFCLKLKLGKFTYAPNKIEGKGKAITINRIEMPSFNKE